MAEETNSLDPLGPEFGKINAPALDSKSFIPFEGDLLRDNKIDYFPIEPSIRSNPHPNYIIKDNLVGAPPNKPNIRVPNNKASIKERQEAIGKSFQMDVAAHQDKNQYAKIMAYNAGPSGNSFYKRYAAYGQEKFDQVGFSPLRDNEAMFNANTTMGDDFTRMMKNSFVPLFTRGFVSGPKSLFKMMQGDFSADTEDARAYEEAAAIGQSTKHGFGAFFNNTAMSFAYTAGIITEAVVEEAVGALLAPVTAGGSFFAATANNARKVGKIAEGIDLAVDGYKAVNQTLKQVNNVGAARKMWKAAEYIGASKVGKFLNPLENTWDAVVGIGKNADNLTGLARISHATGKTAGGLYRDIRNINMALSEARLEGGMTENAVYDKDYDAFYKRNNRAPTNEEQYEMTKNAKEAGVNTMIWNTALIMGTNKVVIPNILKSGIGKSVIQSKIDDVITMKGGKIVLEKTFAEGKKVATGTFEFVEDSLKNSFKGFKKAPIKSAAKLTGRYLKGNLMEGVQENLQDVVSVANEKYYTDAYQNKELGAHLYNRGLSSLMYDGFTNQFTAQGFETFASGALMGMFSGGLNLVKGGLDYGYNKTFNKEKYQEYKELREKHGNQVAERLTALYNSPEKFFDSKIFNYGVQNNVATNTDEGTTKENKDQLNEAFTSQVLTALNSNTINLFKDHIASFKELTPEEFEDAFKFEKGEGVKQQEKIDKILNNIDSVEKAHKYATERFPDPIDLSNYEEGTPEYEDAAILKKNWQMGVNTYVFNNHAFMDTTGRMASITKTIIDNPTMKNMSQMDMNFVLDPTNISSEVNLLKSEIDGLKGTTGNAAEIAKKQARVNTLEDFAKAHKEYLLRPEKAKIAESIFEDVKAKFKLKNLSVAEKAEILNKTKDQFESVLGIELTEDDIEHILNGEKGQSILDGKLETAYKNYLKTANGINPSYVFDTDIDNSFEMLKNYYTLKAESQRLVEIVNLLHDPQGFMDQLQKNQKWMKNLYENRKDYYIDMVNKQMTALEHNELLNKLADQNIFLDLDDFQDFMENGTPPKEFFDETTKQVIPIGSERYKQLFFLLIQAKALTEKNVSKESLDEKLQEEIDKLDAAEQKEIDALDKVETKTTVKTVKKKGLKIKDAAVEVALGQYVELTDEKNGNVITLYSSDEGLRDGDKDGPVISFKDVTATFSEFTIYKIENKPDPVREKEVKEKYNKLKEEVIAKYNEAKDKNELKLYSIYTPLNELPKDLYKELQTAFNESEQEAIDNVDEFDDEGINTLFTAFVTSNSIAKDIIDKYNAKNKEAVEKQKSDVADEFEFKFKNNKYNTANLSDKKLSAIKDQVIISKDNEKNPVKKQALVDIINKINKVLTARRTSGLSDAAKQIIKVLKNRLISQQGNIAKLGESKYMVNNVVLDRVTNFVQKFKSKTYRYNGIATIAKAFNNTINEDGLTESSIDDFVKELDDKLVKLDNSGYTKDTIDGILSTSDNIRNYLTELLENKNKQPIKSKKALLLDIQNFLSENAYEYTRKAGNYLDAQLRTFFTPGGVPVFDESEISREAFDELFGPDSYIKPLKSKIDSGKVYTLASNLRVFDEETGIAGEIDLLLIDENGKLQIIDFKTGEQKKWNGFVDQTKAGLNKTEDYTLQQYTYARLLKKMTGLDAEINIMPIEITINKKEYKIASINKPTNSKLLGVDKWYFPLDAEFMGIKDKLDEAISITEPIINTIEEEEEFDEEIETAETTEEEPVEQGIITLNGLINKTVYYGGKPYVVKKEGNKFILDSQTTIIELEATGDESIDDLDISYYQGATYKSGYKIKFTDESTVTVNGTTYEIKTDDLGNVIGLSPENKPEQVIKNEKLLVAVEIERNKREFINTINELDDVDYEDTMSTMQDTDPETHLKLANVDRIYHVNWNTTVESGLTKLYDKKELTESEKLAVDLWATDAWMEISKLNEKSPSDVYNNALTNIEIINTLLYEGYKEYVEKTGVDESTKRTVKKPASRKSKKSKSTKTEVTPTESTYTNASDVSDDEYNAFIDNGDVSDYRINVIAEKIKNNDYSKLSIKELSIFNNKTSEINNRLQELAALETANQDVTKVSQLNLQIGNTVIVTNAIFGKNENDVFAEEGAKITVIKTTENGVTFKYGKRQKTVSLSELDKHVTTIDIEATKEAQSADETLDAIDKEKNAESIKVLRDFIKSDDAIAKANKNANDKTLEEIYKDLLNDLDC